VPLHGDRQLLIECCGCIAKGSGEGYGGWLQWGVYGRCRTVAHMAVYVVGCIGQTLGTDEGRVLCRHGVCCVKAAVAKKND
jgi:hypothetical protein